jgi:ribosome-associated heat shock protein Hsp15
MRIDKYLWCTRYFKTRNIATSACKKGRIKINDAQVKPSKMVFVGDNVVVRKNQINYSFTILGMPKSRVSAKLLVTLRKDTTSKDAFENQKFLKLAKDHYRKKGDGRPTKKDRRDIRNYNKNQTDESE